MHVCVCVCTLNVCAPTSSSRDYQFNGKAVCFNELINPDSKSVCKFSWCLPVYNAMVTRGDVIRHRLQEDTGIPETQPHSEKTVRNAVIV